MNKNIQGDFQICISVPLNKDIKKENFKKDLMNLIETNHHISMTSDHCVSSNNSFKSFLNAKGEDTL